MKINYIIATFEGVCKRKHTKPLPENVLKEHLKTLLKFKHNLSQITIMKPVCNKKKYKKYYDLDDLVKQFNIPVKIINCDNYGYSNGQWIKAYESDKKFDYYILMEDDYCFNMNNFDNKFIECYNEKFNNNIGFLSCYISRRNTRYIKHYSGAILLSNKTWKKVYLKYNNLYKSLDLMTNKNHKCFDLIKRQYIGSYYQLSFSFLFTLADIKHDDIMDKYNFIYWNDKSFKLTYYNLHKNITRLRLNKYEKCASTCLCIPIQKYYIYFFIYNIINFYCSMFS